MNFRELIFRVVAEQLAVDVSSISLESSPKDISKWDSLATMRIALAIEDELSIQFSTDELISIKSVESVLQLVNRKKQ